MTKRSVHILLSSFFLLVVVCSVLAASVDEKTLGDESAPATIELFVDFQDPFSARWYQNTLPELQKEYIDTGKAKLVVRHFPLEFHDHALNRSLAAECAAAQGKFFEYVDLLFDNPSKHYDSVLQEYAKELNLDLNRFNECRQDTDTLDLISADVSDKGFPQDVSGTPTFFIGGQKIVGAQPYSNFERLIETALSNESVTDEPERVDRGFRLCPQGCYYGTQCIPLGFRLINDSRTSFCNQSRELEQQKEDGATCQNSFECKSNHCSTGKCVNIERELQETRSLLEKVLDFFARFFR